MSSILGRTTALTRSWVSEEKVDVDVSLVLVVVVDGVDTDITILCVSPLKSEK